MSKVSVTRWLEAGRPLPEKTAEHSTSQAWASTIDAILQHEGMHGFLANFEASEHAFDQKYALVAEIAREHHHRGLLTPTDWVPVLEELLEDRFRDPRGGARSARSKATIVGTLFGDYLDARFEIEGTTWVIQREPPQGARRSHLYGFRKAA